MTMHKYQPRSPLQAIDPKAFMSLFAGIEKPENDERADVTVVTIRGPLSQHDDWWSDSYEAIRNRVDEACAKAAPVVVLSIDSPGGDVHGLFDTVRAIRSACDRTGKRLLAHVEGQGCSAAYALATAAESITASSTAEVGSIGVIAERVDETRALENMGYKVSLITTGARKGDGWACTPMSEDEQAAYQADIDGLAAEFFKVVSVSRGVSIEKIAALEAASFRGDAAVNAGLVDELGSLDHLIATLGGAVVGATRMDEKEKEARALLRSIAEDEERSEEERENARKALAALDGDDDEEAEDGDEDEQAESDEDDVDAEDDDEDEQASAAPSTVSAATAGQIAAHGSEMERRVMKLERHGRVETIKGMIAAHGGVSKGLRKILLAKKTAEVKAILDTIAKPKKPRLGDAAATATVTGTQGKGQGQPSQLPPKAASAVKRAMGLEKTKLGVVNRGNVQILGAVSDDEGVL